MSNIEVKCVCDGPLYVRGACVIDLPSGPLYSWTECDCRRVAERITNTIDVGPLVADPTVADSIRNACGCLMTIGWLNPPTTRCPCCGDEYQTEKFKDSSRGWRWNAVGAFWHNGEMTWCCTACWDKHTIPEHKQESNREDR